MLTLNLALRSIPLLQIMSDAFGAGFDSRSSFSPGTAKTPIEHPHSVVGAHRVTHLPGAGVLKID